MTGRMMDLTIGGYVPGNSALHRMDPRTKLIGLVVMIGGILVGASATGAALSSAAALLAAASCGAGPRVWFWTIARLKWMLVAVAVSNLLFHTGGRPLTLFGWSAPFTAEALTHTCVLVAQLGCVMVLSMALAFTTTPRELTRGLERLARPLKRLGAPVDDLGLVALMAMRFAPVFQQELASIIAAQRSRGVDFGSGTLVSRALRLPAILGPALRGALRRADALAAAMTSRGFVPGAPRSEYKPLAFGDQDIAGFAVASVFIICQFITAIYLV